MAIHHDKHAYGNLKKLNEELSEKELDEMMLFLNEEDSLQEGEEEEKIFSEKEKNFSDKS